MIVMMIKMKKTTIKIGALIVVVYNSQKNKKRLINVTSFVFLSATKLSKNLEYMSNSILFSPPRIRFKKIKLEPQIVEVITNSIS